MNIKIISQFFGLIAMICLYVGLSQTERKKLITGKLCADISWVVHYFMLGAYGGVIPNFVGIFRELVFMKREEKKWASNVWWPILFICINFSLGISTFKVPINILPIVTSMFVTISFWCKNPKYTKIISIPVSLSFLIYNCFVGSYIGILNESLALVSITRSMIKNKQ